MIPKNTPSDKKIWEFPWRYKESFFFAFGFLLVGFLVEYFSGGNGIHLPSYPFNLYIGLFFTLTIAFFSLYFKHKPIIKWLASIPAAISAITAFSLLVILMGFIPQTNTSGTLLTQIGLSHLVNSSAYLLAMLYFLTTLGFVIAKRMTYFTFKNIGFLLSHAGLWLTIVSASLGSSDMFRLTMYLKEGETVWKAYDENQNTYELSIAIDLLDFEMDVYPPKLTLINNKTGELLIQQKKQLVLAENNTQGNLLNYRIQVKQLIPEAIKHGDTYYKVNDIGAAPAAHLSVIDSNTQDTIQGWVSCGSFVRQPQGLKLNEEYSLIMLFPEAKRFASKVHIYSKDGINETATIEVNKPYSLGKWKLYQLSYDEKMGKYSNTSIIEIISDPWLPVVYTGIFMMMFGAILMFWTGRPKKQVTEPISNTL